MFVTQSQLMRRVYTTQVMHTAQRQAGRLPPFLAAKGREGEAMCYLEERAQSMQRS